MTKTDSNLFRAYYTLTKPGIIYGNILSAAAGFLLAARGQVDFGRFVAVLTGTSLVIASACVCNNCIDRDIDRVMKRTKQRPLVKGIISPRHAIAFATVLGAIGFLVLTLWTNWLVVAIGFVAFIDYVVLYGIAKRRTVHGTLVGSISGAAPVMAGYVAAAGQLDLGAWLVFIILVLWQMPHFYGIALFRLKDYAAAHIPVLPREKGGRVTKLEILCYVAAFSVACVLLTVFGYAGYCFLVAMCLVNAVWLWRGLRGFKAADDVAWGRSMFGFSLVVIMVLSGALAVGSILP